LSITFPQLSAIEKQRQLIRPVSPSLQPIDIPISGFSLPRIVRVTLSNSFHLVHAEALDIHVIDSIFSWSIREISKRVP
jgi:hypothetical protein